MSNEKITRQQEILNAARNEFIKEGISGARTQAIADNIGVTKAMIHYYFDTKDKLFQEVFREASETLMNGLMEILEESTPLFQKIETFIDRAIDRFNEQPEVAGFVMSELNRHPEITEPLFRDSCIYDATVFEKQIEEAASNYEIAPAQSSQVISNMLSLCMFPYSGKRFLQTVLESDNDAYEQFLKKRREVIKDTVINWLAG